MFTLLMRRPALFLFLLPANDTTMHDAEQKQEPSGLDMYEDCNGSLSKPSFGEVRAVVFFELNVDRK